MSKRHRLQNFIMKDFEVSIDTLSERGWGQGNYVDENNKNVPVEIRGALPGDIALVQGRHIEDGRLQCALLELRRPIYPRIPMTCPHAGVRTCKDNGCGGCTLRDCTYETQLQLKQDIVALAFKKNGIESPIETIIPCKEQIGYRNKMELSFGPDGADNVGVGLHPAGFRYEIIALNHCDLLSSLLPELAEKTTSWAVENHIPHFTFRKNQGFLRLLTLREGKRTGETMVILTTSGLDPVPLDDDSGRCLAAKDIVADFADKVLCTLSRPVSSFYWTAMLTEKGRQTQLVDTLVFGNAVLHEKMFMPDEAHALKYEILPRAFFQPNTIQAETLYRTVLDFAAPYLNKNTPVLDLYCGTGTIALSFASHGHRAIAVDIETQAIENARENARNNGLEDRIAFYAGDTAEILKQLIDRNDSQTNQFQNFLLIVDPPRRGLLPTAYKQIMRLNLKTFIYVSCNPESLAADLAKFREDGYDILRVQPVDMLPQTAHVETVVLMSRKDK